jgi:histidinol-phosphate phosphatase family protein
MLSEEFLGEAHAHLARLCESAGAKIEGFYYCPHSTHAAVERYRTDCDCRKPKPGMILAAARDHSLDLSRSFVIGDRWRDIEMGLNAGTQGILVETGYGRTEAARRPAAIREVPVVANLIEGTSWILRHS